MKREIKFRALSMCKGEWWVYGDLRHYARNPHTEKWTIHDPSTGLETDIDEATIGQSTGLYDKNGKEIFEGDIIREIDSARAFEVIYEAPEFCMADNTFGYRFLNHPENFEVIGNIHNNKDLL